MRNDQEMERTVEQRERCTLAGAGEGGAFGEFLAPLDVVGRQRAQGAGYLAEREVREMPRFERCNPVSKTRWSDDSFYPHEFDSFLIDFTPRYGMAMSPSISVLVLVV